MSTQGWEDMNITRDELDRMSNAFKDDNFRKLFLEYCEEIQDPENRRKYEEDIVQLEKERGVDVTFINPEPGFVVKTSIDGRTKGFVNIAKSEIVDKPKSEVKCDSATGKQGLMWSIPLAQAPPRRDYDNKGAKCIVYDVIFHPDALRLAEKNNFFRKHLIQTACDAVEREHKVKLDRTNLKFPKLTFKGMVRPTVIRRISANIPEPQEPSPLDAMMPPLPAKDHKPKVYDAPLNSPIAKYTTPQYVIKHRRVIDMAEMTDELDAKLNILIPTDLIVEISLPLLTSTSECTLDVTDRKLYLISEQPAKYKLNVELPFPVNDKIGSAKFDKATRKLIVTLPVCSDKERTIRDIYREDSGVESDVRDDSRNVSPTIDHAEVAELACNETEDVIKTEDVDQSTQLNQFLNSTVHYNFPAHFDCNTLDNNLAFTLHVKNVQPDSVEHIQSEKDAHLKFSTIGSGYYPVHYSFYVNFPNDSPVTIKSKEVEIWDNNVIFNLALDNCTSLNSYFAGLDSNDTKEYTITEEFVVNAQKFPLLQEKDELDVSVKPLDSQQLEIEIKPSVEASKNSQLTKSLEQKNNENAVTGDKENPKGGNAKKQKKKNKKRRSLSESYCDDLKAINNSEEATCSDTCPATNVEIELPAVRKVRSFSESRTDDCSPSQKDFKGILKHRSRYGRSISESCSSIDEHSYSCSVDCNGMGSFDEIPEEDTHGLSESCKKTVRFSDVIRKQLFRLDSSILGQRKKNQKKRSQKLRALQRRNSEGDSADYEDKQSPRMGSNFGKKDQTKLTQHDSGLDLSSGDPVAESKRNAIARRRKREDSGSLSDHSEWPSQFVCDL